VVPGSGLTGEAFKECLPPYSPDLNPIEQVFAKLKALLRQATERTHDKLWQLIGKLLDKFQAGDCLNLFRHSGYVSTQWINALGI
jgi:transposase